VHQNICSKSASLSELPGRFILMMPSNLWPLKRCTIYALLRRQLHQVAAAKRRWNRRAEKILSHAVHQAVWQLIQTVQRHCLLWIYLDTQDMRLCYIVECLLYCMLFISTVRVRIRFSVWLVAVVHITLSIVIVTLLMGQHRGWSKNSTDNSSLPLWR